MNINQKQVQVVASQNQLIAGAKGPLAVRLYLDFAAQSQYVFDAQNMQGTNQFDLCQTLYVDNADGGAAVNITIPSSGQRITVKSGQQGYYNVICPNPIKIVFDCAGGSPVTAYLINVAIPGSTWSAI